MIKGNDVINFLLVLGTQKCGTTWLSNQLKQHPQYQGCGIKEWRCIRDVVPACMKNRNYKPNISEISEDYWYQLNHTDKRKFASSHLDNYFSVQKSAITWGENADYLSLGDITGANGLTDSDSLAFFSHHAKSLGFNIKPLYILRDPVERHHSAVKMKFNNEYLVSTDSIFNEQQHSELFRKFTENSLHKEYFIGRTRYDLIIPKLENVYGQGNILYCFAEDLKKEKSIDVVTDYLGLKRFDDETMDGYPEVISNQSSINFSINENMKQHIHNHYLETYAFVNRFFGDLVPASWRN